MWCQRSAYVVWEESTTGREQEYEGSESDCKIEKKRMKLTLKRHEDGGKNEGKIGANDLQVPQTNAVNLAFIRRIRSR